MIHRLALLLGGLAAAVVLAFSLVRGDQAALSAPADEVSATVAAIDDATTPPREIVETVYIAAPRAPKVVHVTRREKATPRPESRSTRENTRERASDDDREGGEHEDREREHEEDDD